MFAFLLWLTRSFCIVVISVKPPAIPVPTPVGGRLAVHGWLILPFDQEITSPYSPVEAYLVHHTPEFPADSVPCLGFCLFVLTSYLCIIVLLAS
jgi:hypothetical protein